jgi:CRISPR-associated protein Csx10
MNGFLYTLTIEEPVLANSLGGDPNSANSLFYIPGGALRGAFIQAYGAKQDAADKNFRRLFLSGETRYLNAYPLVNDNRALPTPLTWQVKSKSAPGEKAKKVYRDIASVPKDNDGKYINTKNAPFKFWFLDGNTLRSIDEEWQVNVHTQRDAVRGRATTDAGAVYRYIALPAGMKLQGVVLTQNSEDAQTLEALLKGKSILLGKARTAGYGRVSIKTAPLDKNWREIDQSFAPSETSTLTLLSPALVRDENGQFSLEIEPALKAHLGEQIKLTQVHRRPEIIGGFNRKWGLPLPQVTAIAAGSVFTVIGATAEKLGELEAGGIGERRAEGFGRVVVNLDLPSAEVLWEEIGLHLGTMAAGSLPENDRLANQMLTRLLKRDLDEQTIRAARKAVPESYNGSIPNSQLSRWRVILRDALPKRDIKRVKEFCESSKGKPGWKKMERARIRIGDASPRLTEWIESALDDPNALSQAWETDFKPERKLGSNPIQVDEGLNVEYRLRLLDAVLAVMAKSGGKNGN